MVHWLLSSFVSATLQVLLQKLADVYSSFSDVDGKLEKLARTLIDAQALIRDAEEAQISDSVWLDLLGSLEEAAYDADDLIDEIAIKISKVESGRNHRGVVSKFISSVFKRTRAPNLNNIQAKLDDMLKYKECVRRELQKERHLNMIQSKLQTTSLIEESHFFGRKTDERKIVKLLVTEESSRGDNVSVIPIVGMMGVGKTALAQILYNYDYQMPHPFDMKMWVFVTKDFDVEKLTRSMIEAATRESTCHLSNFDSLQVRLKEILEEKKFLLVLDDLWNVKRNEWNDLLKPLKNGLKGSKIIVTTRNCAASKLVGTVEAQDLKCLSDQECWSLLKDEALGDTNHDITPELEAIGKEIATKCKGLPLAAKIFGSLLQSKDENEWNNILKSKIWELAVIKDEIIPALRSSYHLLPSHVRQCFAYCSMFPQSYDFQKDKIVRMWMGEGFIVPDKGRKMIEDIGRDYFDQLLMKSFLQTEGQMCKMHNALHDMAQSVSGEKFLRMEKTDDSRICENTRHLSLICEKLQEVRRCKRLRTFLLLRAKTSIKEVPLELAELKSLRVLDLSGTHIDELTGSIGNLKHLRFLDLSNTHLLYLPETTQELCMLQTLRLISCSNLLYLPKSIGRLKSLQHLELGRNGQLKSMPFGIGRLTSLQTVSEFIVGPERCQIKELKDMNNIRGSLCIKQLEKVRNPQEALDANLADKKYLDNLELQWTSTGDAHNDQCVLDKLMTRPHESLKGLTLKRYGGRRFPEWVSDPLFSELTSICFYGCKNCAIFPPLGQLPKLKSLKIEGMHELTKLEEISNEGVSRFQALEILEFRDMAKWEQWVGVDGNDMARLCKLTIVDCPKLIILPSLHYFHMLEKLEFENCPQIPSLAEEKLSNSMKSLTITECLLLKQRSKKDGGEDWTKIEHIPDIVMDYAIVAMR